LGIEEEADITIELIGGVFPLPKSMIDVKLIVISVTLGATQKILGRTIKVVLFDSKLKFLLILC
jgi:hypothetical protein